MADKPPDRVTLGQTDIPPVLRSQADVLPQFTGEALEVQLQTFESFLDILSPSVRPQVAAMLRRAAYVLDERREDRPGPFSMGVIATRELDMWGNEPELASLINEVERLANIRLEAGDEPWPTIRL